MGSIVTHGTDSGHRWCHYACSTPAGAPEIPGLLPGRGSVVPGPAVPRWHSRGVGSLIASTSRRRPAPGAPWRTRVPIVIGALCALLVPGCSVDGEAQSAPARPSLASRLVAATAFPHGASTVPGPGVRSVIADVAGPAGTVEPEHCRAPDVVSEGAAANVGPDSVAAPGTSPGTFPDTGSVGSAGASATRTTGTLTVLITYAPAGLDTFDTFFTTCGRFTTSTAGASSRVVLKKLQARTVGGAIGTRSYARTVTTGGPSGSLSYAITTLVAQHDGVRVYAEHRRQGANPQQISAALDTLFRRAVEKAWPPRG